GHFCPGVSQFWEINTQIILVADALATPVTYLSKLLGIRSLAAFLQVELFKV
ncbi:hypothetical protein L244_20405, partial [Salmonella enterica subsp. enterica serovar Worthington str. BCH-3194]